MHFIIQANIKYHAKHVFKLKYFLQLLQYQQSLFARFSIWFFSLQRECCVEIVANVSPNCVSTAAARARLSSDNWQAMEFASAVTLMVNSHEFIKSPHNSVCSICACGADIQNKLYCASPFRKRVRMACMIRCKQDACPVCTFICTVLFSACRARKIMSLNKGKLNVHSTNFVITTNFFYLFKFILKILLKKTRFVLCLM